MSNWTEITEDHLKAAAHGAVIDRVDTTATGGLTPISESIADAVARVRRALAGRALDVNTAKVPNSLKGLTVRIAVYNLMDRLRFSLTEDQRETRKADNSDLLRLTDNKSIPVEEPDQSAGSGEMRQPSGVETLTSTDRDQYTREGMNGL